MNYRKLAVLIAVTSSTAALSRAKYVPDPIHERAIPTVMQHKLFANTDDAYHSYQATRYRLNMAFDPTAGTLSGSNRIDFETTGETLSTLIVDAVNMDIEEILWQDNSPLLFVNDQRTLKITLPRTLTQGERGRILIRFSSRRPEALTVAGPDASRPDRSVSAYTYTQPDGTRRWFPCHDIPSDKTITELTVTVPRGFKVASNGEEFRPSIQPDGRMAYSFHSRDNIATYLTSVVLGSLQSEQIGQWHNVPLLISAPSYLMPAMRRDTARTAQMMDVFSHFTQTPYPFNKYRQTVAEGYGASMEHQSATTMGGRRIVGDRSGESVVAHELAHQWFGDLVTCAVWGDMWLNEGFASYLPLVFFNAAGETDDLVTGLLSQRQWYFGDTNPQNARPLSTPEEFPSHDIFDQHSYAKGALVLHLMRHVANAMLPPNQGPEVFSRVLGTYLRSKAYGNVRYTDLQAALAQVTGQSWDQFFKEWVLQAGHPQVSGSWTWVDQSLKISLKQDQTTRAENPWKTFSFPLSVSVVAEDGTSTLHWTSVRDAQQEITIPSRKRVKAVIFDPYMIVPGEFKVVQDFGAWQQAFFASDSPFAQAGVLGAMFDEFDDKTLAPFVKLVVSRTRSVTTLALLAGEVNNRPGLVEEARELTSSPLRSRARPVLKGIFSNLEAWVASTLPVGERPSFAALKTKWDRSERVEEREALLKAMSVVDLEETQRLALASLKNPRWTDRDRVALVSAVSKTVTPTTKQFVLDLLENNQAMIIRTTFMDNLIAQKYADPEVLAVAKRGALTHRNTSMRVRYAKLLGFQTAHQAEACAALTEIKTTSEATGTSDDRLGVLNAVTASRATLGCP